MAQPVSEESLGKDFWLFRLGQVISVVGDACGSIALAWWILDATGSAAVMSSVIAPTEFARIFLLPLFGPIGDRFNRKWLIIASDVWRGILILAIAAMAHFKYFNLPLVITLYILNAVGTALFRASAGSIVSQLVPPSLLGKALQQTQAIQSVGGIIGGLAGGVAVTALGISGAFFLDAVSFFFGAGSALLITADTRPARNLAQAPGESGLRAWARELQDGFALLHRIPLLFWFAMVAMVMNFVVSPLHVVLPVLVKQGRGLPPWFLGALESSSSLGGIIGALTVGWFCRKLFADWVILLGIVLIGSGTALLAIVPDVALPVTVMFWIGAGGALANIPLNTQLTLATPDHYRSRLGSIIGFLCGAAAPFGIFVNGLLLTYLGITQTLVLMGMTLILLAPLLLRVPRFSDFFRQPPEKAAAYFALHYPSAFTEGVQARAQPRSQPRKEPALATSETEWNEP